MTVAAAVALLAQCVVAAVRPDWWRRLGTRRARISTAGLLGTVTSVATAIVLRATSADSELAAHSHTADKAAGLALVIIGVEASVAVQIHRAAGRKLGDYAGMLRTEGIYAIARNPMLATLGRRPSG